MFGLFLGLGVFGFLVWRGVAGRNSKLDKAKEKLADAKVEKQVASIEEEATTILNSIDKE